MLAVREDFVTALSNKRLKLPARRLRNESFFSAPQLKRDPLGSDSIYESRPAVAIP